MTCQVESGVCVCVCVCVCVRVCEGELTDSTVACQGVESFRECLKQKSLL